MSEGSPKTFRMASNQTGRMFFGLLAGIHNYTGIRLGWLRAAFIVAAIFWGVGIGLYIIGSIVGLVVCGVDTEN